MPRFTVSNCPNHESAMTNMVYKNPVDARSAYVTIGNFVYRSCPHPTVEVGRIALNAVARRENRVMAGEFVEVTDFFIPTERTFNLNTVTVSAEYLKSKSGTPVDLQQIANAFRSQLAGFVVSKNQKFVMDYDGELLLMQVTSESRGLIHASTEIGLKWLATLM